ncbi:MAG: hypothetical protein WCI73_14030, partial [Phycisphaerae bacterium]
HKALSMLGAYVRQRAQSSMPFRRKPSAPGQPPSSHTGLLRQFLWFAYDDTTDSVVIGPVATSKGGVVLELLEKGGVTTVRRYKRNRKVGGMGIVRISGTRKGGKGMVPVTTWDGLRIWTDYVHLATEAQVALAQHNDLVVFGPPGNYRVSIAPRPYMAPALARELDQFENCWAASVAV